MRTITVLGAVAVALTSTAALARDGEHRFVHQGDTYVYTTAAEKGRTVISGRRLPAGDSFRLVVNGNRVNGVSGGQPVSFRTETARGAAAGIAVATN